MNTDQKIEQLKKDNPNFTFATNKTGTAIAYFAAGVWVGLLSKMINGGWGTYPNVLIDGKPMNEQSDWVEVS
jgi:hypothetical protein